MIKQALRLAIFGLLALLLCPMDRLQAESIGDRLHWPPVFERTFGKPKIVIKRSSASKTKITYIRPTRTVIVKASKQATSAQINRMIGQRFLHLVWEEYLSDEAKADNETRLNLGEIIPMNKTLFCQIGACRLAGTSSGNPVHDAWWNVRMDEPMALSRSHLIGFSTLRWDDPAKHSHGHYSFCLRQRGGNPTGDQMFDFRAPWTEDRRPRATEGLNIHNRLKISARKENLYDWIYTQSEFRNCDVRIRFVRTYCDQVTLLKAFNTDLDAGNFRAFKKNCASLGTLFANRLLPLDQRIKGTRGFVDLPYESSDRTVAAFGDAIAEVIVRNATRNPTSKTALQVLHQRKSSKGFQALASEPKIN